MHQKRAGEFVHCAAEWSLDSSAARSQGKRSSIIADMRSIHAFVRGDVQGVGFRYFVQRRAQEMGLAGWVRNQSDGSVELVAEGDRAALGRLLELAGKGPGLADVDRVEVEWGEATGLKGFTVRV
jgi:acylphosphatase